MLPLCFLICKIGVSPASCHRGCGDRRDRRYKRIPSASPRVATVLYFPCLPCTKDFLTPKLRFQDPRFAIPALKTCTSEVLCPLRVKGTPMSSLGHLCLSGQPEEGRCRIFQNHLVESRPAIQTSSPTLSGIGAVRDLLGRGTPAEGGR